MSLGGQKLTTYSNELVDRYEAIIHEKKLSWTTHLHLNRVLGSGGQGIVYLTERRGADNFTLPVALKIFTPERYPTVSEYHEAMERAAHVAARVARIQHDNLIGVQNFVDRDRIRMMEMEWIEGFDLRQLLTPKMIVGFKHRVSPERWQYLNNVIFSAGPVQPKIKPGVAVAIVRDGLAALAALHREGIVHGDIKPANIMLKRTGTAKIIDIGSAFELENPPPNRACTPAYAAVEVLESREITPRSDIASLGYCLIELISGKPLFAGIKNFNELIRAKLQIPHELESFMPPEIAENELLVQFCRKLIAADPAQRFPTAEDAELKQGGAAAFHNQLVKSDLSSEYDNELRLLMEELCDFHNEEGDFDLG